MHLPSPSEIKHSYSLKPTQRAFICAARHQAKEVVQRKDPRLACIVGPCSIHDRDSALEYADRLARLTEQTYESLFLVMRVFCEKPRTQNGWKGWLYDPDLDGSNNLIKGIESTRQLLIALTERQIPCAAEFLDPFVLPYYTDLITWGFIGARTTASQPHRQFSSSFDFPIGFKNTIFGEVDAAIKGILVSRASHQYLTIDETGYITTKSSQGNPFSHLVLRGSESQPNFDSDSLTKALDLLAQHDLPPHFMVDCSHGNSNKNHTRQRVVLESVMRDHPESLIGVMLESHLIPGKQPHLNSSNDLRYGLSITDSCIGWEETEELLLSLAPISMSSVQK